MKCQPVPGSSGAAAAGRLGSTRLTFFGCRAFPRGERVQDRLGGVPGVLDDLDRCGGAGFELGGAARRTLPGVVRAGRHSLSDVQGNASPRRVGGPPRWDLMTR
jgi:hypothetical protein